MDWLTLLLFAIGIVLLVAGAELLVRGASKLALVMRISPLVIGLTVVAYGTSSPELAVSTMAAWKGQADIAVGNVVGSNIFNVLVILGISALITPLVINRQIVRLDVPVMIAVSVLALLFSLNGKIERWEGVLFVIGAVVYTVFVVWQSRRESSAVKAEYAGEFGGEETPRGALAILAQIALIVLGLAMLGLGSHWLVGGAVQLARYVGVSELVIGLTIVAAGTSLPEVAASVTAALKGERDIAVGNVVGSNIFNILFVLGLSSTISPNPVHVTGEALHFDMPVMIAVAVVCLPIFLRGFSLERWEGALFVAYYATYVWFLVMKGTNDPNLPLFSKVMVYGVMPATAVTIVLSLILSARRAKAQ